MTLKEAYKILEINENSSEKEIKQAYKKLAKKYHPDLYQNNPLADLAEEKLKDINEAYEYLLKNCNFSQEEKLWKYSYLKDGRLFALNKNSKGYTGQDLERSVIYTKIGSYKDGLKNGMWTTYSTQTGNKLHTEFFKDGVLTGERCSYSGFTGDDGISRIENYKDGLKDGEEKTFKELEKNNKRILEYLQIWKYGKEVKRIKYSKRKEKVEFCEKSNIKDFREEGIFFNNDLKLGTGSLIYEDGTQEKVFLRNGKVSYFSTKHLPNGKIEKDFYYAGIKKKKNFLRCLGRMEFEEITVLPYTGNLRVCMSEKKYTFYRKINELKLINVGDKFFISRKVDFDTRNLNEKINDWREKVEEFLISNVNKIEFDQGNFIDYENNKDTYINFEEIKEEYPENFIPKFRKRTIYIGMDNIIERFYKSIRNGRNLVDAFEEAEEKVIELFIDVFYRYSSKEYEFTYDDMKNGGELVDDYYWIKLFLEEKDEKNIPDNLMLFLNLFLKDTIELSLINIYFGLKYRISQLVKEELERLEENLRAEKWYVFHIATIILQKCFKLPEGTGVWSLILNLDYLLNNPKNTISIELKNMDQLKRIYNNQKSFVESITKNNLFPLYEQEVKNLQARLEKLSSEISILEKEANVVKQQKINLNIKKCEEIFSEINLECIISILDDDRQDIGTIEQATRFLHDVGKSELNKEQIKQLVYLTEMNKVVTSKQKYYQKKLPKLEKELKKNKETARTTKDIKGMEPILLILAFIGGGYFGIKNLGFLYGIVAMIAAPILVSMFISAVEKDDIKKINDSKNNLKKANDLINDATKIINRITPFLPLLISE